ncbi:hypothetical protein [Prauserella muralis]|uniref:Uncharacterized protein n=1 Tax=Prauserella muralis TaxID=588067 RepID=A0A2V4BC75_9PSEU|nr:hypothetical protein [Prauserella muralis]PXY32112.1 hypothetical protein BAY60_07385 [Prauserella muralis]TWE24239.1 hypothetical protein FHX69_5552 [Prauserella muralis]
MVGEISADAAAAREDALRQLREALRAVDAWVGFVRQAAEQRVGSTDPDAVVSDPAYAAALGLWEALHASHYRFASRAAAIEAGEVG